MPPMEVLKELRSVQEKYKNVTPLTFQINISGMAKDAADVIENQQAFIDLIGTLPTCNECRNKECPHRPGLGETVRYNCPLFSKGDKNGRENTVRCPICNGFAYVYDESR